MSIIKIDQDIQAFRKNAGFREAIILAGGLGTRLRTAVPDLPKSLAPVGGRPFILYLLDFLQKNGVEKFIFALGYKSEQFEDFLRVHESNQLTDQPFNVQLSVESQPLGTGGAVQLACLKATEKTILVLNGDTFFAVDLVKLSAFHTKCRADCTLSLKPMENFDRYGAVELNGDSSVKTFQEKKFYKKGLINGGVYALERELFGKKALPLKFSFEKEYLEKFCSSGNIFGLPQDEYFIDIGVPEDYQRAQTELKG